MPAQFATAPLTGASGATVPAGSAIFAADPATRNRLAATGRGRRACGSVRVTGALPALEPIERVPRIAVLDATRVDQNLWSLRNLGFVADPVGTTLLNTRRDDDPLANYDIVFSAAGWPSAANPTRGRG